MTPDYKPEVEKARFRQLLEAAQDDLVDAIKQRDALQGKIHKLQNDVLHLAALCGEEVEDPIKQLGLTDAIRYVLWKAKQGPHRTAGETFLTPVDIRSALIASGIDVSEYQNIMASIHTILKRLQKRSEIMAAAFKGGSWVWTGKVVLPPLPPSLLKLK